MNETPIYDALMEELEFEPSWTHPQYKAKTVGVFNTAAKRKHPVRKRETPKQ